MRFTALAGTVCGLLLAGSLAQAAPDAQQRFSPADLHADFAAMYQGLQSAHFDLYAFTSKAVFDRAYRETLQGLDKPMTRFEAELAFEKFAALARMGHTRVDFDYAVWARYLKDGGKVFPFTLRIAGDRVYVEQNKSGINAISPGDQITVMDGKPIRHWLARAETHVSAETPYMAHSVMEFGFARYLWVDAGDADGFDLVLQKADGATLSVRVPARTAEEMKRFAASQPAVLSLEDRAAKILDHAVGYLRPGPFYNTEAKSGAEQWDTSGFTAFVDDAFRRFNTAGVERVIIDLRDNPGGANLFSDPMVAWFADKPFRFASQFKIRVSPQSTEANADRIRTDVGAAGPISRQYAELYARARNGDVVDFDIPMVAPRQGERFKGKVFVLIDRRSYSNCAATAALIQDYGFGTIVGEATSDMATGFGAMEQFTLPKTGIVVGYPKAHFVRPNGDPQVRGVTPDITISVPVVQTPADEVLQEAVAIALRGH